MAAPTFTGSSTSSVGSGSAVVVTGTLFGIGNGASPEVFTIVANATDLQMPVKADLVDVTNFGDQWHRRKTTLNDMGETTFKLFWQMTEPTQANVANGLRYLLINRVKKDFGFQYPDGFQSTDIIPGYLSKFDITGKVGGVYEAQCSITNDGPPSLV